MFGAFRRAKALGVVKTMLQQTLEPLSRWGETTIPSSIYEDPYVLGYLVGIAGFGVKLATQDKLSTDDVGLVTIEAFHAIAGVNGRIAVENVVHFASEQNKRFREGQHQANSMVRVAYGLLGPNDDPQIARMFSQAAESGIGALTGGPRNPNAEASALMSMRYFVEYTPTH